MQCPGFRPGFHSVLVILLLLSHGNISSIYRVSILFLYLYEFVASPNKHDILLVLSLLQKFQQNLVSVVHPSLIHHLLVGLLLPP